MTHTQGPWTNNYFGKDASTTGMGCGYGQSQIIDSKGRALAGVAAVEPDDGSPMYEKGGLSQATLDLLDANARLIAAAPGLLAALKETATLVHRVACPNSYMPIDSCEWPSCRQTRAAIAAAEGK